MCVQVSCTVHLFSITISLNGRYMYFCLFDMLTRFSAATKANSINNHPSHNYELISGSSPDLVVTFLTWSLINSNRFFPLRNPRAHLFRESLTIKRLSFIGQQIKNKITTKILMQSSRKLFYLENLWINECVVYKLKSLLHGLGKFVGPVVQVSISVKI